jgi:hypothetical protein
MLHPNRNAYRPCRRPKTGARVCPPQPAHLPSRQRLGTCESVHLSLQPVAGQRGHVHHARRAARLLATSDPPCSRPQLGGLRPHPERCGGPAVRCLRYEHVGGRGKSPGPGHPSGPDGDRQRWPAVHVHGRRFQHREGKASSQLWRPHRAGEPVTPASLSLDVPPRRAVDTRC